jgi:hypothetical protein
LNKAAFKNSETIKSCSDNQEYRLETFVGGYSRPVLDPATMPWKSRGKPASTHQQPRDPKYILKKDTSFAGGLSRVNFRRLTRSPARRLPVLATFARAEVNPMLRIPTDRLVTAVSP